MTPPRIVIGSLFWMLLVGCGSGADAPRDTDGNGDDDSEVDTGDDPVDGEPGAPVFLDFSVSSTVLTDVSEVLFTAVLTDPDGVDDIVGGVLKDLSGASYGAFATAASEGAYEVRVDWEMVNSSEEISGVAETDSRTFLAEFFDQAGHRVSREVTLDLVCDDDISRPCYDGECRPLVTVDDCGACGRQCLLEDGPEVLGTWMSGAEYSHDLSCDTGECAFEVSFTHPQYTCDDVCGDLHTCLAASYYQSGSTYSKPCGETGFPSTTVACICVEN